jgi:pyridinium-3,5-bisthiocarboxylic acid mononucleotide nickel chelatase
VKIAYFDCVGGVSGDMLLGALADAGAPDTAIQSAVNALHLPDCELSFERVMRGGLSAVQATVRVPRHETPRHLNDLLAILSNAELSDGLKDKAGRILRRLAEVEAGIHNAPLDSVHLHELGGDDTLVDVVGVLAGLEALAVDSVWVSPLPLARGWTQSAHGPLPLPAPATLSLLQDVPVRYVDVEAELVTPTGAALLTSIANGYGGFPAMRLNHVGSGAGRRALPFPNVVRLWLGEAEKSGEGLIVETLMVIETNIDDMNPQLYEHVMGRLLASGALDVTITPVQMKKNRPAVLLAALCQPEHGDRLARIFFEETTTLGVRRNLVERVCLPRRIETVNTPFGPIRVKVAEWDGHTRSMPEYEDCRLAAEAHHVPLTVVMAATQEAAREAAD